MIVFLEVLESLLDFMVRAHRSNRLILDVDPDNIIVKPNHILLTDVTSAVNTNRYEAKQVMALNRLTTPVEFKEVVSYTNSFYQQKAEASSDQSQQQMSIPVGTIIQDVASIAGDLYAINRLLSLYAMANEDAINQVPNLKTTIALFELRFGSEYFHSIPDKISSTKMARTLMA